MRYASHVKPGLMSKCEESIQRERIWMDYGQANPKRIRGHFER